MTEFKTVHAGNFSMKSEMKSVKTGKLFIDSKKVWKNFRT